jgi:hypothetical protein
MLSVTLGPERADASLEPDQARTWTIDNTEPTVAATVATPVATIAGAEPHYFVRDEFTMKLDPTDDQPGYVVAEFRVNGDGWHHYYGWPDAPPGTPFKFTPRGTTIKELVYGSLASEGLSPQPWEPREPGWGTHRIEYRAIDAAGNIGTAKAFKVTLESAPACTATISGKQQGALVVKEGVTCLSPGATIAGQVTVAPGASLMATKATVTAASRPRARTPSNSSVFRSPDPFDSLVASRASPFLDRRSAASCQLPRTRRPNRRRSSATQ